MESSISLCLVQIAFAANGSVDLLLSSWAVDCLSSSPLISYSLMCVWLRSRKIKNWTGLQAVIGNLQQHQPVYFLILPEFDAFLCVWRCAVKKNFQFWFKRQPLESRRLRVIFQRIGPMLSAPIKPPVLRVWPSAPACFLCPFSQVPLPASDTSGSHTSLFLSAANWLTLGASCITTHHHSRANMHSGMDVIYQWLWQSKLGF